MLYSIIMDIVIIGTGAGLLEWRRRIIEKQLKDLQLQIQGDQARSDARLDRLLERAEQTLTQHRAEIQAELAEIRGQAARWL